MPLSESALTRISTGLEKRELIVTGMFYENENRLYPRMLFLGRWIYSVVLKR